MVDTNYVINRNQVKANFKTLISYRNSKDQIKVNYYKRKLRSGKTFIAEIIKGKIEFAPSKFVGYQNNTMEIHSKRHRKYRSGDLTDQELQNIYGKRLNYDNLLDSFLQSFYHDNGINGKTAKPKTRLHYFIRSSTYKALKHSFISKPEFFNPDDIIKYSAYAGKPYRKNNLKDRIIGKGIREKLYDKTNYWLKSVSVSNYKKESNALWQIGGYFSKYTWGRIFKETYHDKLIYFTIGVDFPNQALIIKLDCQSKRPFNRAKLTKEQVSKFDNFIKDTGAEWLQIDLDEIENLNWDKLISKTNNFIRKYDSLYEDVIKYVWGSSKIKQPKDTLEEVDPPDSQTLPISKHSFKGRKIDFLKRQLEGRDIGYAGELLVLSYEKKRLEKFVKMGMKPEHTSKEKGDGFGYDIKSYTKNGKTIYIEVKTTKSNKKESQFSITPTELDFSKKEKKSYWLYRVYNFDKKNNSGKVYKLNGNLYNLLDIRPESYVAVFKG